MTTTGIIFFIIKWFEFFVLFLSGKELETTKTRQHYWRIAIIPIVVFALVEGLRWGRLIDWNNAVVEYEELNSFVNERNYSNPLYTILLYSLKCLGLPFSFFVVLQCGFLMYSALFILQDYKKYLRWILPCLIMVFVTNENFIRFYFALSFLFIAFYYYLHESIKRSILFSVISVLIHFAQIPLLLLLFCSKYFKNKQIPRKLGVFLYICSLFLADISQMDFLVSFSDYIVSVFGGGSDYRLFSSLNSMNDVINGTAYGTEGRLFTQKLSTKIANLIIYVPLIWMSSSYLRKERNGNLIYNLTVISLILATIFGQAELLHRFPQALYIFVAISFAIVITNYINRGSYAFLIYLMLFCYFYAFLNAPFVREDYMMYFLWDSNGAATNFAPYYQ